MTSAAQLRQLCVRALLGRQRSRPRLDLHPQLVDLDQRVLVQQVLRQDLEIALARLRGHEAVDPAARLDIAGQLQPRDRLAHHVAADAEYLRQFQLRRQALAGLEGLAEDLLADLRAISSGRLSGRARLPKIASDGISLRIMELLPVGAWERRDGTYRPGRAQTGAPRLVQAQPAPDLVGMRAGLRGPAAPPAVRCR